jgi:hypothetical protein
MITNEIREAIRPYSIAVAPDSLLKNSFNNCIALSQTLCAFPARRKLIIRSF